MYTRLSEDRIETMRAMYKNGASRKNIADAMGVSDGTVAYYTKDIKPKENIQKKVTRGCKDCLYWRSLSPLYSNTQKYLEHACHYMLFTGDKRGCSAQNCDKKLTYKLLHEELVNMGKTPISDKQVASIIAMKNAGMSYAAIAAKLGLGKSTVQRYICRLQNGSTAGEVHEKSLAVEVYEKSPDKKTEPIATATATATGKTGNTMSDTTIAQTTELVKSEVSEAPEGSEVSEVSEAPVFRVPYAVMEACRTACYDISQKIEDEQSYLATLESEFTELTTFLEAHHDDEVTAEPPTERRSVK